MHHLLIVALLTTTALVAGQGHAQSSHGTQNHSGSTGHMHNEHTMPGLRGPNVSMEESKEMQILFQKFRAIDRTVTNLPNGIRTLTTTSDPQALEALISHVVGMIGRVEAADDPQVFIQSPTLDIFFLRGAQISTQIDVEENGISVIQTSEDPEMVIALKTHAEEVTDMVNRGMHAVHERMMRTGQTH